MGKHRKVIVYDLINGGFRIFKNMTETARVIGLEADDIKRLIERGDQFNGSCFDFLLEYEDV